MNKNEIGGGVRDTSRDVVYCSNFYLPAKMNF